MKIDPRKELRALYRPPAKDVVLVDVPPLRYLMIDGRGDPGTSKEYADAVAALFAVAYTAKFMLKKAPGHVDFAVMPLESLWWADDMRAFERGERSQWKWTAMIMQPAIIGEDVIRAAIEEVRRRKRLPALDRLRLAELREGPCAQVLHVGPFSEEGPTIARLHQFIQARGRPSGKHHEIYMSDIRRAEPRKWRTIVRQPMKGATA